MSNYDDWEAWRILEESEKSFEFKSRGEWYVPVPHRQLKKDKWTAKEALLLFANVEPEEAHYEFRDTGHVDLRVGLTRCIFLGQNAWASDVTEYSREELETKIKELNGVIRDKYRDLYDAILCGNSIEAYEWVQDNREEIDAICYWEADILLGRYLKLSQYLSRLYDSWTHRADAEEDFNENERHCVSYYLEWIARIDDRGCVQWWDEAVKQGMVSTNKAKPQGQATDNRTALYGTGQPEERPLATQAAMAKHLNVEARTIHNYIKKDPLFPWFQSGKKKHAFPSKLDEWKKKQ